MSLASLVSMACSLTMNVAEKLKVQRNIRDRLLLVCTHMTPFMMSNGCLMIDNNGCHHAPRTTLGRRVPAKIMLLARGRSLRMMSILAGQRMSWLRRAAAGILSWPRQGINVNHDVIFAMSVCDSKREWTPHWLDHPLFRTTIFTCNGDL